METQPIPEATPLAPTPVPPVPQNVPPQAVPPPPPTPKIPVTLIVAVLATALLVSGVFFGLSFLKPKEVAVVPTPTPTAAPTPTPIRQPSAIAALPEFMQFKASVATLSAAIAGYNPQDPSLTPPTLVLPLGFGQ